MARGRHVYAHLGREKLAPPREWHFNAGDYEHFRGRFWRCPERLVEDGTWARLWRPEGRARGGGAAGSLLPVLALHAHPGQRGAETGWSAWTHLSRRRMARLAGLDKDTTTVALGALAATGLVEVQLRRMGEGDPRTATWLRVSARAYPVGVEAYLVFPAEAAYGGFWAELPGEAARHLLVAWAASPGVTGSARELAPADRALRGRTGMGRTALRRAAEALIGWRGPQGARLVVRRDGLRVARLAPRRAVLAAARRSGAVPGLVRPRPVPARPELPSLPGLPPCDGPATFESRKAWWVGVHLKRWAQGELWRGGDPARTVTFVDFAPGDARDGLPSGLAAACALAKRTSGRLARAGEALRVVAVEPDPRRREALWRAADQASVPLEVYAGDAEAYVKRIVGSAPGIFPGSPRDREPLLFFLGAVERPAVSGRALRGVVSGGRQAVAVSKSGASASADVGLWTGASREIAGSTACPQFARQALRNGARRVLAVPLCDLEGAPCGTLVHVAADSRATVAFKRAVSPRAPVGAYRPMRSPHVRGVADELARHFAGRAIRWSGPAAADEERVRLYALARTTLLPGDLTDLRRELVWRGWRVEVRPVVFSFPVTPGGEPRHGTR